MRNQDYFFQKKKKKKNNDRKLVGYKTTIVRTILKNNHRINKMNKYIELKEDRKKKKHNKNE